MLVIFNIIVIFIRKHNYMETIDNNLEQKLDLFLDTPEKKDVDEIKIKDKSELVEKVDRKLVVEDGRELLREINYNRY